MLVIYQESLHDARSTKYKILLSLLRNYVKLVSFRVITLLPWTRKNWYLRNVDKSAQRNSLSWASNRKITWSILLQTLLFSKTISCL